MNSKEHKFVCTSFLSSGCCLYGKNCKFSHPTFLASNDKTNQEFERIVKHICKFLRIKKSDFISKNQFSRDNTDILFWEYDQNGDSIKYTPSNKLFSAEHQIWYHFYCYFNYKNLNPNPNNNNNLVGKERLPVFKILSKGDIV